MRKFYCLFLIISIIAVLFSACKKPDAETSFATGTVQKEKQSVTVEKTVTEPEEPDESGADEPIGEVEQISSMQLPAGARFKTLCLNETYREGSKELCAPVQMPDLGKNTRVAEEYVYDFDPDVLKNTEWIEKQFSGISRNPVKTINTLSALEEELGDNMILVTGRAFGTRKGYLTYYRSDLEDGKYQINYQGNTVTDFSVAETLTGQALPEQIKILENYAYFRLKSKKQEVLMKNSKNVFTLTNDALVLLILERVENTDYYQIFGDVGTILLSDDYKNYDEEYLQHLAGYLNNDPAECYGKKSVQFMNSDGTVSLDGPVTHIGRSVKEALKANEDNLLVAMAQKYKLRLWPSRSRQYEELGFPGSWIANTCIPDGSKG